MNIHFALVLLLAAILGFVAATAVSFLLSKLVAFERTRLVAVLERNCRWPLRVLLPAVAMLLSLPAIDTGAGTAVMLPRILSVAAIACTGWLAISAVKGFVEHVIATHSIDHADNFEARQVQTKIRLLGRVLMFVILIVTVAGVLMSIPSIRNIGISLFASAGIAGLAVGLAARPALSNVIAGIQIALTQPIRLEDAVVVEGEWGWIEEINMTFVVVRIWDLRRLVLPISYFIEKPFQNWTRNNADILGSVMLYVDYSVPLDEVRAEFGRALRDCEYWDGKVEVVHVTECTQNSVEIRLLMSAGTSPAAWELRCAVRERLIGFLQRNYPRSLPRVRLTQVDD